MKKIWWKKIGEILSKHKCVENQMKSEENMKKLEVNRNLKKYDEFLMYIYLKKLEWNRKKFEVNKNLKKMRWILLWTYIWRNSNEMGRKYDEILGEHKW